MEELAMKEFNKAGFPIIIIEDSFFQIKAIDFWNFRSFQYAEVRKVKYYKKSDNFALWPSLYSLHDAHAPYKLKVIKKNGADWTYDASPKYSEEFAQVISEINTLIANSKKIDDEKNN